MHRRITINSNFIPLTDLCAAARPVGRWVAVITLCVGLAACGDSGSNGNAPPAPTAGTLLIANGDDSVTACAVDANGAIGRCQLTPTPGLAMAGSLEIAGNRAYLGNLADSNFAICDLGADGKLSGCIEPDDGDTLWSPMGIVVTGSRLYATNEGGSVALCALDGGGLPISCGLAAPKGTFQEPSGAAMAQGFFFVADHDADIVAACQVLADGKLGPCSRQAIGGMLDKPAGVTASGSRLYVTNLHDDSIVSCLVTPTGELQDCAKSVQTAPLETPTDIAINGNKAYVTNLVSHTVATCDIDANWHVSTCTAGQAGGTFRYPGSLAFVPASR
ncbi:MAG: hypothetical protein WBA83_14090 [Burkholderiaceae bacterium]